MNMPCISYSNISEHDMDMMFVQLIVNDPAFVNMFLDTASYSHSSVTVTDIELSKTDARLGESDIVVTLSVDSKAIQLLIEDKIDAIAMPEQPERYIKRGEKALKNGECDAFLCFILCPQKYYENSKEAQRYPNVITYEAISDYLSKYDDQFHYLDYQQIEHAIRKAKRPANVILNEHVNAFFRKYKIYQEAKYPNLDLRTSTKSNGYWPHYGTRLGNVFLYHKIEEGKVDLTFSGKASRINELERFAEWLRSHGINNVRAVVTGKAGALRIDVPKLNMTIPFEDNDEGRIIECFNAINELVEMANSIALAGNIAYEQH